MERFVEIVVGGFLFVVSIFCLIGSVAFIFAPKLDGDSSWRIALLGAFFGLISLILLHFSIRKIRGKKDDSMRSWSPVTLILVGSALLSIFVAGIVSLVKEGKFEVMFMPIGLMYLAASLSAFATAITKLINR